MITKQHLSHITKWILIALLLLWIFAVTGVFYVVQKPFIPTDLAAWQQQNAPAFSFSAVALGRTLLDALTALWLWLIALGVGLWVYRWLAGQTDDSSAASNAGRKTNFPDKLEAIIFGSGLGFGAMGLLVFFLGLAGLITSPIFYSLAVILTLIALPQLATLTRSPAPLLTRPPAHPLTRLYLALTLGLGFTIALLPPTDWDGLLYHLTGPQIYIQHQQIIAGINNIPLYYPALTEMNYMWAMVIHSDVSAKLLHFGFALLLAGLVHLIAREHLRVKKSWLAILFLLAMPMVMLLSGWAYTDLMLSFYEIAALYALLNWRKKTNAGRQTQAIIPPDALSSAGSRSAAQSLALSGIFIGLAMGIKYTSATAALILGGLFLWRHWQMRSSWRNLLVSEIIFVTPAVLVAAPWYIKNWFFTGNPVYPAAFGGVFWDEFRAVAYANSGSGIGFDPLKLMTLPITLTLGIYDINYSDGRSGPLFLAFLPLLLAYGVFRYRNKYIPPTMNWLLLFALGQYTFWTLGVIWSVALWQSRLLLPAFVALSPVMAWIMEDLAHLDHPKFSLRNFLELLIAAALLLGLVDQIFNSREGWIYYRPYAYLTGQETRPEYLRRRLGAHYTAMEAINVQLPAGAVVDFLWEPRSYYCQKDCRSDELLDRYAHLQYLYGQDAAAIAQAWKDEGITHVLVFKWGLDFLLDENTVTDAPRPDPAVLEELEANYFEQVIDVDGGYQIYQVK